jgi:hypothetical protein
MSRDEDITASIKNAVEQQWPAVNDSVQKFRSELAGLGAYESSRGILGIHRRCIEGYRLMCATAATHVAEIEGEDSKRHAEAIGAILKDIQPRITELFGWNAQASRSNGSLMTMASQQRSALQTEMDAEVEHIVRDLRLGMAGGMNVKKRQQFYFDNRGGAGQFAVNSPGAMQAVGRDQIAGVTDFASLTQLMREVRQQVADAGISPDDREVVEDAVVAVEREIEQPQPDQGRVKRLVLGVGKAVRDVGVSVTAQAIAAYAKTQGWL